MSTVHTFISRYSSPWRSAVESQSSSASHVKKNPFFFYLRFRAWPGSHFLIFESSKRLLSCASIYAHVFRTWGRILVPLPQISIRRVVFSFSIIAMAVRRQQHPGQCRNSDYIIILICSSYAFVSLSSKAFTLHELQSTHCKKKTDCIFICCGNICQ